MSIALEKQIENLSKTMTKGFVEVDQKIDRLTATMSKGLEDLALATARGFEAVDKRFEKVDERFEKIDERFEKIDERFDEMDKRFNERFDKLEMYTLGNTKRIEVVEDKMLTLNTKLGFK